MLALTASAAPAAHRDLTVTLTGLKHDRGHVIVKLYHHGQDVLGTPAQRAKAEIHGGRATVVFSDTDFGDFAIMAFHDENDNDDLDHNFLKIPSEPMGFSNGFRPGIFTGMPSFEKLKFQFDATTPAVELVMK